MTTLTRAAREAARYAAAAARSAPASTSSSGRHAVACADPGTLLVAATMGRPNVWQRAAWRRGSTSTTVNATAAARARMGLSAAPTGIAAEGIGAARATAAARAASASGNRAWGPVAEVLATLRVYHDLSKFKLSAFVVSTAAAGYVLGSGEVIDWEQLGWTSLGTMLCSSSANTWNQIFEIKNDSVMARTMRRPLPSGRCSVAHAALFGVVTGMAGVGLLREKANDTTAALGAGNVALYALCYTPMKRVHWLNTWAGAVVGAVPPLMGWAAAREGAIEPASGVLAAALYFWQMPHFMALAYMAKDDYVRGGYRMLSHPSSDPTGRRLAGVAMRNSFYMFPLGALAVGCGLTTAPFAYEAALLAAPMALSAAVFYRRPSIANARNMFYGSLLYLPAFQALACAHRVPRAVGEVDSLRITVPKERWWAWSEWSVDGWRGFRDLNGMGDVMDAATAAPFPFLPPPIWPSTADARCPHRAECEGGVGDDGRVSRQ